MSTEVNATTVRLPQFSPNQPLTWFRRAERHFNLKKITSSATKADYTLEFLPDSVFVHIAPWLDTQPAEIKYEDLKATLLRTFCPTSAVRARRIIELPQQLGSDTTPTNAWHEISTLQQLPDVDAATGTHKQLDLAKEIWLMCLAPQVRSALHDTDNRSIQELLTEAEHRHTAHYAATRLRPASSDVTEVAGIRHQRPHYMPRSTSTVPTSAAQSPRRSSSALRQADKPYICWYHRRHGDAARNCSDGCKYKSKNSTTGCA